MHDVLAVAHAQQEAGPAQDGGVVGDGRSRDPEAGREFAGGAARDDVLQDCGASAADEGPQFRGERRCAGLSGPAEAVLDRVDQDRGRARLGQCDGSAMAEEGRLEEQSASGQMDFAVDRIVGLEHRGLPSQYGTEAGQEAVSAALQYRPGAAGSVGVHLGADVRPEGAQGLPVVGVQGRAEAAQDFGVAVGQSAGLGRQGG